MSRCLKLEDMTVEQLDRWISNFEMTQSRFQKEVFQVNLTDNLRKVQHLLVDVKAGLPDGVYVYGRAAEDVINELIKQINLKGD